MMDPPQLSTHLKGIPEGEAVRKHTQLHYWGPVSAFAGPYASMSHSVGACEGLGEPEMGAAVWPHD